MGFEDDIFRRIDRQRAQRIELSPSMARAHRKALMTLRNPHYAIQEKDFEKVYDPASIRKDKAWALAERSRHDRDLARDPHMHISKQMADVFEAVILEESEQSNWLGENATTFKTTDYDDFKNYVDMIAEWYRAGEGTQVVAFGVDATFGSHLSDKFRGIRENVEEGTLSSVRYFKDTRGDFTGTRNNIPRTVIGASQPVVEELGNLWVNGRKEALANHPFQRVMLVQIRYQLEQQLKLAETIGQTSAAEAIRGVLGIIVPLEQSKRHLQLGALNDDPVVRDILKHTREDFAP